MPPARIRTSAPRKRSRKHKTDVRKHTGGISHRLPLAFRLYSQIDLTLLLYV